MTLLRKVSHTASSLFYTIPGSSDTKADHEKLSHYIVNINQKKSLPKILEQTALCLNEIIKDRLVAVVIKKGHQLDVWIDPMAGKSSISKIITKDFCLTDKDQPNYEYINSYPGAPQKRMIMNNLFSHEIYREKIFFKIYTLPGRKRYIQHTEISKLIFQSACIAISTRILINNLSNAAVIDPLTGCYNRREFENQLKRSISGAIRHKHDLSVFMFDLDHFKHVNDQYGHLAGDDVLKNIASIVQSGIRKGDILARYGGEEFIAILPETGKKKALELAERLRIQISKKVTQYNGHQIKVTASFGVTQMDPRFKDMKHIIQNADDMLYKAKVKGRNMIMPGLFKIVASESNPLLTKSKIS
ncbi:MAG: GGDEF domain-containing protein [Desulfobacteraceae bacterium]|nr:GGDEF domain-containing protein [Desulfobacteraceae bacterium]